MTLSEIEKEINELLSQKDALHAKHMDRYRNGSATRARTTSHNAHVSQLNERILWLREEVKRLSK